jgi:hypothetical protein
MCYTVAVVDKHASHVIEIYISCVFVFDFWFWDPLQSCPLVTTPNLAPVWYILIVTSTHIIRSWYRHHNYLIMRV